MLHVVILSVVEVDAIISGLALVGADAGGIGSEIRGQVIELLHFMAVGCGSRVQDHGRGIGVVDERIILGTMNQREVLGRFLVAVV